MMDVDFFLSLRSFVTGWMRGNKRFRGSFIQKLWCKSIWFVLSELFLGLGRVDVWEFAFENGELGVEVKFRRWG